MTSIKPLINLTVELVR